MDRWRDMQAQQRLNGTETRALLATHHLAGYGWALNCCGRDRHRAEDVLQTAYMSVLDGSARYDGRAAFKTWLFAVIRRTAANEWRRNLLRTLRFVPYQECHENAITQAPDRESLDRTGLRADFQAALARLPGRQREVLHLVFYEELTIQQASGVMGVSLGSARRHYERGKQKLRTLLHRHEALS